MGAQGNWIASFGLEFAVPDEVCKLVADGTIVDVSWGNDVSPSFVLAGTEHLDSDTIRLWVSHPNPALREGEKTRFSVFDHSNHDDPAVNYQTDDLATALRLFLACPKLGSDE